MWPWKGELKFNHNLTFPMSCQEWDASRCYTKSGLDCLELSELLQVDLSLLSISWWLLRCSDCSFLLTKYFVNIELKILTICWECMMWGGDGGISYLVGTPGLLQPSNSVTLSNVTLDLSLPLQSHRAASGEEK